MAETMKAISDLIVDKLEGLVDGSDRIIPLVRDFAGGDKTTYPMAEVLPTGGATTDWQDTGRNERVFSFDIKLYQEQSEGGKGAQASSDAIKTACDAILLAFDTDKNFNFEVQKVTVPRMEFDFSPAAGPKVVATFTVECVIIVTNV